MQLASFILVRVVILVGTLFAISLIVTGIIGLLPGDAVDVMVGNWARGTGEPLDVLRAELGLDVPWWQQYLDWVGGMLSGNLGRSITLKTQIGPLLLHRLWSSFVLAVPALALSVVLGIALGIWSAIEAGRLLDSGILASTLVILAVPTFVMGPLLVFVFSVWLGWLPSTSAFNPDASRMQLVLTMILPVGTLVLELLAHLSRTTRGSMLNVLSSPYVRMARLKGLPGRSIILSHALRNALAPVVTIIAFNFGWLIGGVVVVERVFSYPGLGSLLVSAIEQRDIPLIRASVFAAAAVYCVANLLADVAYALLDPRIAVR